MNQFDVPGLCESIHKFTSLEKIALLGIQRGDGDNEIDDVVLEDLRAEAKRCMARCTAAELEQSFNRLNGPFLAFLYMAGTPTWSGVKIECGVLLQLIQSELSGRKFCFVPKAKARLIDEMFEKADGESVGTWRTTWKHFPSVITDSQEAVYCYALDCNTACIFHLMRVAEHGLRGFARHARVKLPKKKLIEWAQWQEILTEIRKKADAIAQIKAGPRKDDLLEFYNGALGQFYAFKDEYRNHVMHARESYDEFKAAGAMSHVHSFMEKLSVRINEKGRPVRP